MGDRSTSHATPPKRFNVPGFPFPYSYPTQDPPAGMLYPPDYPYPIPPPSPDELWQPAPPDGFYHPDTPPPNTWPFSEGYPWPPVFFNGTLLQYLDSIGSTMIISSAPPTAQLSPAPRAFSPPNQGFPPQPPQTRPLPPKISNIQTKSITSLTGSSLLASFTTPPPELPPPSQTVIISISVVSAGVLLLFLLVFFLRMHYFTLKDGTAVRTKRIPTEHRQSSSLSFLICSPPVCVNGVPVTTTIRDSHSIYGNLDSGFGFHGDFPGGMGLGRDEEEDECEDGVSSEAFELVVWALDSP
ncbi:hypothetical protein BC830DRAFT_1129331 [Chytriomyces sp. MP71]|nr:hypothetical protein BC830DRAFT_1129331 [Chytriomyces sp. MP71]